MPWRNQTFFLLLRMKIMGVSYPPSDVSPQAVLALPATERLHKLSVPLRIYFGW